MKVKLPCKECRGMCCKMSAFSEKEYEKIKDKIPAGSEVLSIREALVKYEARESPNTSITSKLTGHEVPGKIITKPNSDECAFLLDGRCSIFTYRPEVCRKYGEIPSLPCAFLELKKQSK